ncbi:hypothetical protein LCGC14_1363540 [marine sediment metagenome]|uniref:Uncharacterized protein n=1 Tax=marine sediment metagenome TaxID=412755 RepID=A0A0F9K7W7_9ZZZZ
MDGEEIVVYGYLPDGKGWRCKMWGGLYIPQPPLSPEEVPFLKALREQTGYKEEGEE